MQAKEGACFDVYAGGSRCPCCTGAWQHGRQRDFKCDVTRPASYEITRIPVQKEALEESPGTLCYFYPSVTHDLCHHPQKQVHSHVYSVPVARPLCMGGSHILLSRCFMEASLQLLADEFQAWYVMISKPPYRSVNDCQVTASFDSASRCCLTGDCVYFPSLFPSFFPSFLLFFSFFPPFFLSFFLSFFL